MSDTTEDAVRQPAVAQAGGTDWAKLATGITVILGVFGLIGIIVAGGNRFDRLEQSALQTNGRLTVVEARAEKVAVFGEKLERQGEDIKEIKGDIKELLKRK